MLCSLCGRSITGPWMAQQDAAGNLVHLHADVGPYGNSPTCSMMIAERTSLISRGWTPPKDWTEV
jgi:hypothetical protein